MYTRIKDRFNLNGYRQKGPVLTAKVREIMASYSRWNFITNPSINCGLQVLYKQINIIKLLKKQKFVLPKTLST